MMPPDDPGVRFKAAPSRWRRTDGDLLGFLFVILIGVACALILWWFSR